MKRIFINVIFITLSATSYTQGVQFEKKLNWMQIREKAKQENKGIFIDMMTTWCGPCKLMDKQTFSNPDVGQLLNEKFIAVRVQADSTDHDDSTTMSWYRQAKYMMDDYKVTAFPTLVFLNADGVLTHKIVGYHNSHDFMKEVDIALHPELQYKGLLEAYGKGRRDVTFINSLAERTYRFADTAALKKIINDFLPRIPDDSLYSGDYKTFMYSSGLFARERNVAYPAMRDRFNAMKERYENGYRKPIFVKNFATLAGQLKEKKTRDRVAKNYIDSLDEKAFFTKDNLEFTSQHSLRSTDRGFIMARKYPARINKITRPNFAEGVVKGVIFLEEVKALVDDSIHHPAWPSIRQRVKKYGAFGEEVYLEAKAVRELNTKLWNDLFNTFHELFTKYPARIDNMFLNATAWAVFQNSNDTVKLREALRWTKRAMDTEKEKEVLFYYIDTYANLLYKLGKKKEAIRWENKALELSPGNPDLQKTLDKMKAGEKTWP